MHKKFSKHLAVLLAILMIVSLLPFSALASEVVDPLPETPEEPAAAGTPPAEEPSDEPPLSSENEVQQVQTTPPPSEDPAPPAGPDGEDNAPASDVNHYVYIFADAAAAQAAAGATGDIVALKTFEVANGATLTGDDIAAAEQAVAADGMKVDGWFDSYEAVFVIGDVLEGESSMSIFLYPNMVANAGDGDSDGDGDQATSGEEDPFTVTFMVGEKIISTVPVREDGTVAPAYVLPTDYPATATTFLYWYAADDETAASYDFSAVIEKDLVLQAKFDQTFLIKYKNAPGGAGDANVVHNERLKADQKVPAPPKSVVDEIIAPENMYLAYWYVEDSEWGEDGLPVQFAFGTHLPTGDMTLVPYFSDMYYVFFVSEGTQVPFQTVKGGAQAAAPAAPSRAGYNFSHWSVGATSANGGAPFSFGTAVTTNLTLYANWTAKNANYKVVYWREKANIVGVDEPGTDTSKYEYYKSETRTAQSGSELTEAQVKATLASDAVEYSEYKFADKTKWTIAGNGTTVINVYYSRILYTFTFDLNPGTSDNKNRNGATMVFDGTTYGQGVNVTASGTGKNSTAVNYNGTKYSFKAKYEQDIEDLWPSSWNATFEKETSTRNGTSNAWGKISTSTFTSWSSTGLSSSLVSKRFTVTTDLVPSSGTTRTFTAGWGSVSSRQVNYWLEALPHETETVSRTFDRVEKEYVKSDYHSQAISLSGNLTAKTIEGVKYVGSDEFKNNTYNFFYDRNRFDLSFDTQGGSDIATQKNIMYGERLTGYKPGEPTCVIDGVTYVFAYWSTVAEDPDGYYKFEFTDDKTMPNGDLKLFAQYTSTELTVNFYSNFSGTEKIDSVGMARGKYLNGETTYGGLKVGDVVEGEGTFKGWYIKVGNTSTYLPFSYETPITEDMFLYAGFETAGFTVSYKIDPGTGTKPVDGNSYYAGKETRADNGINVVPPDGKVLIGWDMVTQGEEPVFVYPGTICKIWGDTEFQAVYGKPGEYVLITYISNYPDGATEQTRQQWVLPGSDINLYGAVFELPESLLIGWSTEPGENNTITHALDLPMTNVTESLTLYGVWTGAGYTVTFITDGNGYLNDDQSRIVVDQIKPGTKWSEIDVPTTHPLDDYYFAGWTPVLPAADALVVTKEYKANFALKTPLTIKADDASKFYDGAALTKGTASVVAPGALKPGDRLVVTMTAASTITNVGTQPNEIATYKIFRGLGDAAPDVTNEYKITEKQNGTLTVNPLTVTITADSLTDQIFKAAPYVVDGEQYVIQTPGLVDGDAIIGLEVFGQREAPGKSPVNFIAGDDGIKLNNIELALSDDGLSLIPVADGVTLNYTFILVPGEVSVKTPGGSPEDPNDPEDPYDPDDEDDDPINPEDPDDPNPDNKLLNWAVYGEHLTAEYDGAEHTNSAVIPVFPDYTGGKFEYTPGTEVDYATSMRKNVENVDETSTNNSVASPQTFNFVATNWSITYESSIPAENEEEGNTGGLFNASTWFNIPYQREGTMSITPVAVDVTLDIAPTTLKANETFTRFGIIYTSFITGEDKDSALWQQPAITPAADAAFYDSLVAGPYTFGLNKPAYSHYGNYTFVYGTADAKYDDLEETITVYEGSPLMYDANGVPVAAGVMAALPDGVDYFEDDEAPVDTGDISFSYWKFLGWAEDPTATTPDFAVDENGVSNGLTYTFTAQDEEDGKILYAVWEIDWDDASLNFNLQGSEGTYDGATAYTANWTIVPEDLGFDVAYTSDDAANGAVKPGYIPVKRDADNAVDTYAVGAEVSYTITLSNEAGSTRTFNRTGTYAVTVKVNPLELIAQADSLSIKAGLTPTFTWDWASDANKPIAADLAAINAAVQYEYDCDYDATASTFAENYPIVFERTTLNKDAIDPAVLRNYEFATDDGLLTVLTYGDNPGETVTLTADSDFWVYDGNEKTKPTFTPVTFQVPDDDETYTVAATVVGSQTKVGSSDNVITVYTITDEAGNIMNKYFTDVQLVKGTLTVTPRDGDFRWTDEEDDEEDDDGSPKAMANPYLKIYDAIPVHPVIWYDADIFDETPVITYEPTGKTFINVSDSGSVKGTIEVAGIELDKDIAVTIVPRPYAAMSDDVTSTYAGANQTATVTKATDTSTIDLLASYEDGGYQNFADNPYGLVSGHSFTDVSATATARNVAETPLTMTLVDGYGITDGTADMTDNYMGEMVPGTFTITPAVLHIYASTHTIANGDALPKTSTSYKVGTNGKVGALLGGDGVLSSVLKFADTGNLVTGKLRLQWKLPNNNTNTAGTYPITFMDKYKADNYDVVPHNGSLTIGAPGEDIIVPTTDDPPVIIIVPPVIIDPVDPEDPVLEDPVIELDPEENPTVEAPQEAEMFTDEVVPQAQLGAWALLNLIVAVLALVFAILLVVTAFKRNKTKEETEEEQKARMEAQMAEGKDPEDIERNKKSGLLWRIISIIAGIAAPIVFLLTENIRLPMVFTDRWTLLMVIILVVQVISMLLMKRARNQEEDSDDEQPSEA